TAACSPSGTREPPVQQAPPAFPRCPMPARPYILAETTWQAVRDTRFEVAVLPWGATEAHNYHLPYATDNIQCDHVAAEAARRTWCGRFRRPGTVTNGSRESRRCGKAGPGLRGGGRRCRPTPGSATRGPPRRSRVKRI